MGRKVKPNLRKDDEATDPALVCLLLCFDGWTIPRDF